VHAINQKENANSSVHHVKDGTRHGVAARSGGGILTFAVQNLPTPAVRQNVSGADASRSFPWAKQTADLRCAQGDSERAQHDRSTFPQQGGAALASADPCRLGSAISRSDALGSDCASPRHTRPWRRHRRLGINRKLPKPESLRYPMQSNAPIFKDAQGCFAGQTRTSLGMCCLAAKVLSLRSRGAVISCPLAATRRPALVLTS